HSAVFAHSNSIVSFLAKVELARAGISATNLASYRVLQRSEQREAPEGRTPTGTEDAESENEDYAHREVIQRVLAGEYDVGVATRQRFEIHSRQGKRLRQLHTFRIAANVLVASPDVAANVAQALQQSLYNLNSKDLPRAISQFNRPDGRIRVASDSDFDEMRGLLTNEYKFFETGVRPSPAQDRGSN